MDWHELGMRERERKRAVVWGLVGLVGELSVGELNCQARFYAPEIFGLLPWFGGRALWTEHVPEGEYVWFWINLHGENWGFITLEWNRTKSTLLFKTTEGRPNVGHWILTLIRLESDNWTPLNHLIWCSPLSCWLSYNLATAVKWAKRLITHGWEFCSNKLQCNAWVISNKTALRIFVIFHWAVVPKPDLTGKQLRMATLMHAAIDLGGRNAHSCFSFH